MSAITSISINNTASYQGNSAQSLTGMKLVNLIYGQNGTGKSTIARYLQSLADEAQSLKYSGCSVIPNFNALDEILVYNSDFVESNFRNKDVQNGIFNIGEKNKADAVRQEEVEKLLSDVQSRIESKRKDRDQLASKVSDRDKRYTNKIYNYKQKITDEANRIWPHIGPYQQKKAFLAKVEKHVAELPSQMSSAPLDIAGSYEKICEINSGSEEIKNKIPIYDFSHNIDLSLLSLIVIDTSSSGLKGLIDRLKSEKWFTAGLKYLETEKDLCPFCQRELGENLRQDLFDVFDQQKSEALKDLGSLYETIVSYKSKVTRFLESYSSIESSDMYVEYEKFRADLVSEIDSLIEVVKGKTERLSESVYYDIGTIDQLVAQHQERVLIKNSEVDEWNESVKSPESAISEIINQLFFSIAKECQGEVSFYLEENEIDVGSIKSYDNEIECLESEIVSYKAELDQLNQTDETVDITAKNINERLKFLGFTGFEISPENNNYRIVRNSGGESAFGTLSEGEKTLITFLYFVDMCNSNKTQGGQRIVVLDDPITSMSMNLLYEVSSTIIHDVIGSSYVSQVILFTHNIFFLNEFIIQGRGRGNKNQRNKFDSGYSLYEVRKDDGCSTISVASADDFLNDYESYWKVLSDLRKSTSNVLIANSMRNIVEYFSSFVCGDKNLSSVERRLTGEHKKLSPVFRYINRGSHSDSYNVTMFSGLDFSDFENALKIFFEEIEYKDHFEVMSARYLKS